MFFFSVLMSQLTYVCYLFIFKHWKFVQFSTAGTGDIFSLSCVAVVGISFVKIQHASVCVCLISFFMSLISLSCKWCKMQNSPSTLGNPEFPPFLLIVIEAFFFSLTLFTFVFSFLQISIRIFIRLLKTLWIWWKNTYLFLFSLNACSDGSKWKFNVEKLHERLKICTARIVRQCKNSWRSNYTIFHTLRKKICEFRLIIHPDSIKTGNVA